MNLPLRIAFRYLFAKKSHNVINIISIISAVGICVGSLALTIILSVYNGFDNLIQQMYESYQADFIISPQEGKSFNIDSTLFTKVEEIEGVIALCPIVEENVFVKYGDNQAISTIKGIDSTYCRVSNLSNYIKEGEFKIMQGEVPHAIVGEKLAFDLRLRVRFVTPIELYYPKRGATISMLNPLESLNNSDLYPSGVIRLEDNAAKSQIFTPLYLAQELIGYSSNEVNSIELFLKPEYKANFEEIGDSINSILGEKFIVKDRYKQNEALYKMMKGEKLSVYLILFFVILIISINIFSSLVMLMIDKEHDMSTYLSMGAPSSLIQKVFILQGWLISLIGGAIGVVLGVILCYIQQIFGIISMPGNYLVSSYPVSVQFWDVIITFIGVAAIGFIISYLASRGSKKNI